MLSFRTENPKNTIALTSLDDYLSDGTQIVSILAQADGYLDGQDTISVIDNETPTLILTIDTGFASENDGTLAATISRNTGTVGDLIVALTSSDTTESTLPATVTIFDGSDSAEIIITIKDDTEIDGTQSVTFLASATGFVDGRATLDVLDDDDSVGLNDVPGSDDDDILIGTAEADNFTALGGDDSVAPSGGADVISLGSGEDTIIAASVSDLDGDSVSDFSGEDAIIFTGQQLTGGNFTVTSGSAIIAVDSNDDGTDEGTFTLEGDFTGGDFMAARTATDTVLTFEEYVGSLSEGVAVDTSRINGIMNENFLLGSNLTGLEISFEASAGAQYNNTVGLYEVDSSGNLVNVQLLAQNAKAVSGPISVTGLDAANSIGFFLIQDGDRKISDAAFSRDRFEFMDDGSGGFDLADDGALIAGVNVFFSHDAALNPDGEVHVLSGISNDSQGAMRIGFEDLMRNGRSDDDFQDVLLHVDVA